ncbi:hypothetical protein [Nocardioides renjunii]|uniref:hypothetical protein n=1 Tax=Nocardioides renjunii TaxID=3095075 RepID=UPI002B00148F|nr:hypothetical protein [Nocardioides sp. S-34]WQQ22056.1 hypothetical protein SHK17_19465 [Nocardioides sp. S-34]
MTTLIVIIAVIVVVLAVAAFVVRRKNRQANMERADELRNRAAAEARTTIAPAQERAAAAEAEAAEVRARAERAEEEARDARAEAAQIEATHEAQVRDADRLDPRVDHKAADYTPQVAGTTDQQPTSPSEVDAPAATETRTVAVEEPAAVTTTDTPAETASGGATDAAVADGRTPLLPRRTPGAQEMPGKPIEQTDGGGGWFTRKDADANSTPDTTDPTPGSTVDKS